MHFIFIICWNYYFEFLVSDNFSVWKMYCYDRLANVIIVLLIFTYAHEYLASNDKPRNERVNIKFNIFLIRKFICQVRKVYWRYDSLILSHDSINSFNLVVYQNAQKRYFELCKCGIFKFRIPLYLLSLRTYSLIRVNFEFLTF